MDEILWCDHSNEISSVVLSPCAICFSKFHKMKFGNLLDICFWLNLAVKGLNTGCLMAVELYLSLNQGDHIGASITDFKAVKGALL